MAAIMATPAIPENHWKLNHKWKKSFVSRLKVWFILVNVILRNHLKTI
jgi:hypothetical protein